VVVAHVDLRGAPANGMNALVPVELRQHVRDVPPQPGAPRRGDDQVLILGQGGEHDVVVVREHRDLVLRGGLIAFQQQVLQGALQADISWASRLRISSSAARSAWGT